MLYQLENGSLLNIESLDDIEEQLTSDQLGMVTALISISESTIDANDILVKGLIRYIDRYGVKNEDKIREKLIS